MPTRKKQAHSSPALAAPFIKRAAVHITALVVLSFGIYAASLANGFASDDGLQIVKNPLIRDWHRIPELFTRSVWAFTGATRDNYYRPLHFFLYTAVYHFFGLAPWAYHLLMLLIHATTTVLVYLLARRWLPRWQGALLAGVLFAVHPIHSEAVLWIAAVPDVVMTLLAVAALYAFAICGGRPRLPGTAAIAALYFGALLTKETGAMLPPLFLAAELLLLRRSPRDLLSNVRLYAALAVISCVYLLMRLHALGALIPGQGSSYHLSSRVVFFTATWLAGRYLLKLILPLGISFCTEFSVISRPSLEWLAAVIACLAIGAAIVILRYRPWTREAGTEVRLQEARISFFLFMIAIPLIPALSLNSINATLFGERYLYLPSVGFVLLAGELWSLLLLSISPRWQKLGWGTVLLVVCAAVPMILPRIGVWRNQRTVLACAIEQSPGSASFHEQFADFVMEQGEIETAELHYRTALRLGPNARSHNALGAIMVEKRQYPEAIQELRAAIALDPRLAVAHANLGTVLMRVGQSGSASAEYNEALRLEPANVQALSGLGELELRQNRLEEAILFYRRAIQADESYPSGHINLGFALVRVQRYQEAVAELQRALELAPRHAAGVDIHFNLGVAYRGLNMAEPAIREFQAALRLRPDFEPARLHLLDIQQIINRALSNSASRPAGAR